MTEVVTMVWLVCMITLAMYGMFNDYQDIAVAHTTLMLAGVAVIGLTAIL